MSAVGHGGGRRREAGGNATTAMVEEARVREKRQTLFYRRLAAEAEAAADHASSERLNELHADEQHHLSRLTAWLLEGGRSPRDLRELEAPEAPWPDWEEPARAREADEVAWYEAALEQADDPALRELLEEIVASERRHREELGGKWMSA